jgi:RNA polymerase sigma factor (TIGR02999 family)
MSDEVSATVSRLLQELQQGDRSAFDKLFPIIYQELHLIAHRQRRRWRSDATLNTTALVHELYLKLDRQKRPRSADRAYFFAVAAKAMRQILCNYARDRRAQKRGDGAPRISLDDLTVPPEPPQQGLSDAQADMLAQLEEALRRMERIDRRGSEVVECRFYGGMTVEETAAALGIAPRTVKRDWQLAQAWLHREMKVKK